MIIKSRILLLLILGSVTFMSCEPEALPEQDNAAKFSKDIKPVGDSGNEQNEVDKRDPDTE